MELPDTNLLKLKLEPCKFPMPPAFLTHLQDLMFNPRPTPQILMSQHNSLNPKPPKHAKRRGSRLPVKSKMGTMG